MKSNSRLEATLEISHTLKSLINVALRLLIFTIFSHAYALIREPTFINFKVYFMCFNDPLRTYGASTINIMNLIC